MNDVKVCTYFQPAVDIVVEVDPEGGPVEAGRFDDALVTQVAPGNEMRNAGAVGSSYPEC